MDEYGKSDGRVVTCETAEQCRGTGGGGGGGKAPSQGEHGRLDTPRTQRRAWRAKRDGPCARSSTKGQEMRGSRRCCTMSPWSVSTRPTGRYARRRRRGLMGSTWASYGQDLEANLLDLHARVQSGAYRAKPSRRVYIPKADGRLRPLGIASLEDKIVQRAVVEVLNAVYEVDFLGFSYGFRPGRKPT